MQHRAVPVTNALQSPAFIKREDSGDQSESSQGQPSHTTKADRLDRFEKAPMSIASKHEAFSGEIYPTSNAPVPPMRSPVGLVELENRLRHDTRLQMSVVADSFSKPSTVDVKAVPPPDNT